MKLASLSSHQPLSQASVSSPALRFGIHPYDKLEIDPYNPKPDSKKAREILTFQKPEPKAWFQNLVLWGNRLITLPMKGVTPVLGEKDIAILKAIPKDAGNILVGPHPDWPDGNLMTDLFRVAGKVPAGMFMAAETLQGKNAFVKKLMSWYGIVPVRRGKSSPEATEYLTSQIAKGGWGGVFPEGAIYYSRQVMPMEYGAVRMDVEAAVKVQQEAAQAGNPQKPLRPILMTPFAHIYMHTNPAEMKANMLKALAKLEEHPDVFGKAQSGEIIPRVMDAAERIMDSRAKQYGIPRKAYVDTASTNNDKDLYTRAKKLETLLIEELEQKYFGKISEGFTRRRSMKIRMEAYNRLANTPNLSPEAVQVLKQDIQKSLDVITLGSFEPSYKTRFKDLETWGEFLRRLQGAVGLPDGPFGHRKAIIKVLPPIDMHPLAKQFQAIEKEEDRMAFLFKITEDLRGEIQQGVNELHQQITAAP